MSKHRAPRRTYLRGDRLSTKTDRALFEALTSSTSKAFSWPLWLGVAILALAFFLIIITN